MKLGKRFWDFVRLIRMWRALIWVEILAIKQHSRLVIRMHQAMRLSRWMRICRILFLSLKKCSKNGKRVLKLCMHAERIAMIIGSKNIRLFCIIGCLQIFRKRRFHEMLEISDWLAKKCSKLFYNFQKKIVIFVGFLLGLDTRILLLILIGQSESMGKRVILGKKCGNSRLMVFSIFRLFLSK